MELAIHDRKFNGIQTYTQRANSHELTRKKNNWVNRCLCTGCLILITNLVTALAVLYATFSTPDVFLAERCCMVDEISFKPNTLIGLLQPGVKPTISTTLKITLKINNPNVFGATVKVVRARAYYTPRVSQGAQEQYLAIGTVVNTKLLPKNITTVPVELTIDSEAFNSESLVNRVQLVKNMIEDCTTNPENGRHNINLRAIVFDLTVEVYGFKFDVPSFNISFPAYDCTT